jgi:hypothetical protein
MSTRLQLRSTLRERLEDTSGAPLWADASLNEFLAAAVRTYGATFPQAATAATAALVAGNTGVALPAGVPQGQIVAVRDAHGRDVPKATERQGSAPADATGLVQAWSVWGGTLRLQRPVSGDEVGAWAIDYLGGRELVADDVTQQPIEGGDEPIVVALAGAQAMERRLVEDAKRGARVSEVGEAATRFAEEAGRLIAARKRRVRSGYVMLA